MGALEDDYTPLLDDILVIYPMTSRDSYGARSYGTPRATACRWIRSRTQFFGSGGQVITSSSRCYLDGQQINLLTRNEANFDYDTLGWGNTTNCVIARDTSVANIGAASLSLTSVAGGDMSASTQTGINAVAVDSILWYTASIYFRAAVSARNVRADIIWYDASGNVISTALGTPVADGTGSWTRATVTSQAPTNARWAAVRAYVIGTGGASEIHRIDGIQLEQAKTASAWASGSPIISEADKVQLPDNTTPPILSVEQYPDDIGPYVIVVHFE